MANTTFTGPVTALNGFIGGANTNPHTGSADTQQGGNVAWTVSNASTVTIASGTRSGETLSAVNNDAVLIYFTVVVPSTGASSTVDIGTTAT
jgi:hypothetical protein